ncbi:Hypothetical protein LBF_2217 [Leptospira biflexa serovar Patoc strain 'Patoc 1 (Ames)']|uniref:SCO family protein n=1 Tax=Leptospira biflexa TaxID=172 RepID=UPI000165A490|nr:SCO family protein [Leptospira biflexa]ABZ94714.1 Hypothetical protein LBF_2217 [Leptospira biflexa serovar Patoc strain 'Patoc 1 (Ames)']
MKILNLGWKQTFLWFFVFLLLIGLSVFLHSVSGKYRNIPCEVCQKRFLSVPKSHWIVIYPGLVGCGKKCPMALESLRQFRMRFPDTSFTFYFLVTDPKETEEAIKSYLAYYETSLSIQALRPETNEEIQMYRRLGAYLPEHPILKQRDEHGTQFFLIPPHRTEIFALPKLEDKDWKQIQKAISSNAKMIL